MKQIYLCAWKFGYTQIVNFLEGLLDWFQPVSTGILNLVLILRNVSNGFSLFLRKKLCVQNETYQKYINKLKE